MNIIEQNQKPVSPGTLERAEILAKKLDALNQHFDIVDSTINECTEYVQNIEAEVMSPIAPTSSNEVLNAEIEEDFITGNQMLSLLKQDFMTSRDVLLDNLTSGRSVLNAVNSRLTMFEEDGSNAELVSAFATLMKTINDSTKLLVGLYSDIVKTYRTLAEESSNKPKGGVNIEGGVTINNVGNIPGNISDIIQQIKQGNSQN